MSENQPTIRDIKNQLAQETSNIEEATTAEVAVKDQLNKHEATAAAIKADVETLVGRIAALRTSVQTTFEHHEVAREKVENATQRISDIGDGSTPLQDNAVARLGTAGEAMKTQSGMFSNLEEVLQTQVGIAESMETSLKNVVGVFEATAANMEKTTSVVEGARSAIVNWMAVT